LSVITFSFFLSFFLWSLDLICLKKTTTKKQKKKTKNVLNFFFLFVLLLLLLLLMLDEMSCLYPSRLSR